jgi:uncharacterized protein YneF (UPF0154 family)
MRRKQLRFSKLLAILAVVLALLTGCSNESKSDSSTFKNEGAATEKSLGGVASEAKKGTSDNAAGNNGENKDSKTPVTNRKLIKNAEFFIETTDFDVSIKKLEASIKQFDGYIEANNITGTSVSDSNKEPARNASYTIRIPSGTLDAYLNEVGNIGNVLTKTITTDDVTDQYFDTEARITSLKVQEQRLLELLKQTGTLKDVIELEKELSSVRYEIENLTTTLKKYDSLVDYSTVRLTLQEVAAITDTTQPKTVGERISYTFKNNIAGIWSWMKDITVFLIGNSPVLLVLGVLASAGIFIARRLMKKYKNNISG